MRAREIDRQLTLGILEPVKFSTHGKRRIVRDYKITVNRATIMETFPLPRGVPNSKVDLKQQVALDDEAKRMVTG